MLHNESTFGECCLTWRHLQLPPTEALAPLTVSLVQELVPAGARFCPELFRVLHAEFGGRFASFRGMFAQDRAKRSRVHA